MNNINPELIDYCLSLLQCCDFGVGTATLLAGLASAGATAATSIGGAMRSLKKNKQLAKYQQELSMQNWLTQQAYNHPSAQLARLSEAGLNPHLAYGNGSLDGNTATQAPETVDIQPVDFQSSYERIGQSISSGLNAVVQSRQINQDIKQSNAQIEAIYDSMKTSYLNRLKTVQDMQLDLDENSREWQRLEYEKRELEKNIEYVDTQIDSIRTHTDAERREQEREDSRLLMEQERHDQSIKQMARDYDISEAKLSEAWSIADRARQEADNYPSYVEQVKSSTGLNNAQARKISAEALIQEYEATFVEIHGYQMPKNEREALLRMCENFTGSMDKLRKIVHKRLFGDN